MPYAYSNNGLSYRSVDADYEAVSGEVIFQQIAQPADLTEAFTGYVSAYTILSNSNSANDWYSEVISAGAAIISESTPSINSTYNIAPDDISNMQAEQLSILTNSAFTNGQTTTPWLDIHENEFIFINTSLFTNFLKGIGIYVNSIIMTRAAIAAGIMATPSIVPGTSNVVNIP